MKTEIKQFFKHNPGMKIKPRELARKLGFADPEGYASLKLVLFNLSREGYLERLGKRYLLAQSPDKEIIGPA